MINGIWSMKNFRGKNSMADKNKYPEWCQRYDDALEERHVNDLQRKLISRENDDQVIDLSNNDYLRLARNPQVIKASIEAMQKWGASSSSSPLISGYTELHQQVERSICQWHGFDYGLIWNSGFTANQAILQGLPQKDDIVLVDRLIHNSMIKGILGSKAHFSRYRHCDIDHLENLLKKNNGKNIFVVTESVFSMDGDYPDLESIAALKEKYKFFWIVDEAHALGWYGKTGSGLVEQTDVVSQVDLLVGTMGKALGSMGAYTLFHQKSIREYLINFSSEFIYSTYLAPVSVAAAAAAISIIKNTKEELRLKWQQCSKVFRNNLSINGWNIIASDSSIVPIILQNIQAAAKLKEKLELKGIRVGFVRPPTVPNNSSRIRISLNSELNDKDFNYILHVIGVADK